MLVFQINGDLYCDKQSIERYVVVGMQAFAANSFLPYYYDDFLPRIKKYIANMSISIKYKNNNLILYPLGKYESEFDFGYEHQHNSEYELIIYDMTRYSAIECSICLEEIKSNSMQTICNHRFHIQCLADWNKTHNECPLCRHTL